MNTKSVSEPNHVAVDLYYHEPRTVNGRRHSTIRKSEIRVVDRLGKTVCAMENADQAALDLAWRIAEALDNASITDSGPAGFSEPQHSYVNKSLNREHSGQQWK